MSTIRERPVQHYSGAFVCEAKEQDFVVEDGLQLTFSFFVVDMEYCRHHSCSGEL